MTMLRVYLFSGLELIWGEHPLPPLAGAAAHSLLAYLLTYRDRSHTRDLLAGTFWPDLPEATARRRLSQSLWQVRHFWREAAGAAGPSAPPPLLQAEGAGVQIHPDLPLWLDTEEFARQHAACIAGGAAASEAGALAVDLYRGEFLAGHYADWAVPQRERLRGMLLEVLEKLLAAHKSSGAYERALAYAQRLAAEDPWHEGAHREVMRLYHLAGRDAQALAQYELCRRVLAEELGADPASETTALAAEIAAQADLLPPLLPATARPVRVPLLERPDQLPLVGRRAEMAELVHQVELAAAGNGGLTIVYGEAGVGKSRLLREVAGNAEWRGLHVAWGHCYELASPPAYRPLVEVLRSQLPALRQEALPLLWQAELSRLLPELAPAALPALPPAGDRNVLLEAIASALLAAAAPEPLLVLLEDAQWMDPASLEALHYLLPRLSAAPLLILISVRSEELAGRPAAALAAMERTHLARRLEPGRLDQDETAELVRRALALEQVVPRFSARLYAETAGNPFFLVETLWALVEEGLLYRDRAGVWSTPWDQSTADYGELPLPAGAAQSIGRRLERLPPQQRELLQLAAVIGREVSFPLWLSASRQDEDALLAAADALCASGLLLAAGAGRSSGADYTFGHDLVRRVCYEQQAGPRRRTYHRRVAQALAALSPEEPAALAYHWTQAAAWDEAARWHELAGDQALALYANADAVAHYTQALQALEQMPGPPDLQRACRLHQSREAAQDLLGDRGAQALDLQAMVSLAEALPDDRLRAEAALRQAGYANATGDFPGAIAAAQRAVILARAGGDVGREAAGNLRWGQALMGQGSFALARVQLELAAAIAHREGLLPAEAEGLRLLGSTHWCLGEYAQAGTCYTQSLDICRRTGDRRSERMARNNLGLVLMRQGRHDEARAFFEQALQIAREIGDLWGESKALTNLAGLCIEEGNLMQGQAFTQRALEISRQVGSRANEGVLLNYLGNLAIRQGDCARARTHAEQALALYRQVGDRRLEGAALNNLGEISMYLGCFDQARQYLEQALAISLDLGDRQSEGPCQQDLGQVLHRLGAYDRAAAHYEAALRIYREVGDTGREGEMLSLLGLLSYHRGDLQAAQRCSQQALAAAEESGSPLTQATVLTHLGHILADLDRPGEAAESYRRALAIRRDAGQPHLAIETLAGLAGLARRQGDLARARAQVEEILAYLQGRPLDGTEEPQRIYLTCNQVLDALHDPRAAPILTAAHALLLQQAAGIGDDELRRSFLTVAVHRQVTAAYRDLLAGRRAAGEVEQRRTVSLPRAGAPLGRPLRPDEFVAVSWTVHAPDDEQLPGKVARRRRRIVRLLAEARSQGAIPRDEDLAAALGVSLPTVRRDMAALRAQGHHLPTRGRQK